MEWKAIKFIGAIALAFLFCVPGLAQPLKRDPDSSVKDRSDAPIKIGALLSFSGGVELYGAQAKLGIDLATQQINSSGGILGHPLQIIYADDGTRPGIALDALRKLIGDDDVLAVIGPITSQNVNAVVPTMQREKIPLLYATNYEGGQSGRYFLNTVPNQDLGQLLPYMRQKFGETFFLLGADRVWPHKMFEASIPVLSQIAWKGDGLERFISQAGDQGLFKKMKVAFLGLSETDLPSFHGNAENVYVATPFVATSVDPEARAFVDAARAHAGADTVISNYVLTHYNAVMAIRAALEKAGKIDKEAMVDALEGLSFDTPTGAVTIGKNHHSTMNMFVAEADKDSLMTIQNLGEIAPETFGDLSYVSSMPPLEVTFKIAGGHYSGAVTGGNLFLQTDISQAPRVRFSQAKSGKLYTLMMLDFDGDAVGSWPDKDAPGKNSPIRHWIVGNIPGELLRDPGYSEPQETTQAAGASAGLVGADGDSVSRAGIAILQSYRYPHIPVVSDRYGIYLFEQKKRIEFDPPLEPITNFDYRAFLSSYHLVEPVASNWFVAIYTSESPFSGRPFRGNDVSATWHQDLGTGDLGREQ
jgi:branched-chain amino acid transport system substrate-binding protein/urea transport system substrate-binding protein